MGNAERIISSADIIIGRAKQERVSVVVSAVSGVSNKLQESIDECVKGNEPAPFVSEIRTIHKSICKKIQNKISSFDCEKVLKTLEPFFIEYQTLLSGCISFAECPDTVHCRIMGMGELLSSAIMEEVLRAKKQKVLLLDSRNFIFTTGNQKEGDADYHRCYQALANYRDGKKFDKFSILIFPGFICSWNGGAGRYDVTGLLGRNGSDFSAAIVASSLDAKKVEFWSDVDGVFTADPRIVQDAILVNDMTYQEAMELAFFGSKVLHPKTLAPLHAKKIEAWSLNSFAPEKRGTRIGKGPFPAENSTGDVRGISALKNTTMISVSGTGMKGRVGIASRIFATVSRSGVSILLITQSSSEYTITFCVQDSDAEKATDALKKEFELEIIEGIIDEIDVRKNCAIVSIVGDNMVEKRGVAARFFSALSQQDVNLLAIAQGSSERCLSCVVAGECGDMAVRAAHRFFFNTAQTIEVFVFGVGTIGKELLNQIKMQQSILRKKNVDIKVLAISTRKKTILEQNGIALSSWEKSFNNTKKVLTLDEIISFVKEIKPLNPVFVDCTASSELPERYVDILKAGMSIVTPNKKANSMKIDYYHELRKVANRMRRRFLYETNVGAGLPIIDTLQNLFKSGDKLTGFTGIMSGSLSYIFGRLDEDVPFSKAVAEAKELGFTEPDPRDDLNGMDVARKALIIARETGADIELEDIKIDKVFPKTFDSSGSVEQFMKNLPKVDEYFSKKISQLRNEKKVLRMGASIMDGKCKVGILEVDKKNPLYGVTGGENAFVFHTERYAPIPLTVRGYGAGAAVTAAGVFGDILRTVSFNLDK